MAFAVEEYPNCLILPTDWKEKKKMKLEDAAQYAYDNNFTSFNYNPKSNNLIFFYTLSYKYCNYLIGQKRHYNTSETTVLIRPLKNKINEKKALTG